jgi:hypothetical protein
MNKVFLLLFITATILQGSTVVVWTKTFGGSGNQLSRSVQQTTDGGYIITGYTSSFGDGAVEITLTQGDRV